MRGFEPNHPGDRVTYQGLVYRIDSLDRRTGLAYLMSDTDETTNPPGPVNFDNLEFAWCPKSHGGSGPPDEPHPQTIAATEQIRSGQWRVEAMTEEAKAELARAKFLDER